MDDAKILSGAVIDLHIEPDLLDIELLGPIHIGHGDDDDLELPVHDDCSVLRRPSTVDRRPSTVDRQPSLVRAVRRLRTAWPIRCSFSIKAKRTWPSPPGPKPTPGEVATSASLMRCLANSSEPISR